MKSLLIGLLALGSVSAFALDDMSIKCSKVILGTEYHALVLLRGDIGVLEVFTTKPGYMTVNDSVLDNQTFGSVSVSLENEHPVIALEKNWMVGVPTESKAIIKLDSSKKYPYSVTVKSKALPYLNTMKFSRCSNM